MMQQVKMKTGKAPQEEGTAYAKGSKQKKPHYVRGMLGACGRGRERRLETVRGERGGGRDHLGTESEEQ